MRKVRAIGPGDPADDGGSFPSVILQTEDGERLILAVDEDLRAALTAAQPPSPEVAEPAVPAPPAHPLTPREIQVRVRAGESPEDLAEESGTPLDRIMRFASAVIEERIRIGDEARRARARREGDGILVPFGETVDRRFAVHGIDPATVLWDSFRRPDGSWVVIATWTSGGTQRRAHWAFSLAARTVLPADEIGSDLLSDRPLRPVVRAVPDRQDPGPRESAEVGAADTADVAGEHPPRYDEAYAELYDQDAPPPAPGARNPVDSTAFDAAARGSQAEQQTQPLPLRLAAPPSDGDDAGPGQPAAPYVGLDDLFGRPRLSSAPPPDFERDAPVTSGSADPGRAFDEARTGRAGTAEPETGQPGTRQPTTKAGNGDDSGAQSDADSGRSAGEGVANDGGTDSGTHSGTHSGTDSGIDSGIDSGTDGGTDSGTERRRSSRGKAAREQTRIPSWDDILLGVRRKQD